MTQHYKGISINEGKGGYYIQEGYSKASRYYSTLQGVKTAITYKLKKGELIPIWEAVKTWN